MERFVLINGNIGMIGKVVKSSIVMYEWLL